MAEQFKWVSFYTEFATKLMEYKTNRTSLIEKLQRMYSNIGMKLPKLEKDDVPKDIDPFTVFGLFNKGITDANRASILGGIKSEFGITADVPNDFSGIPVLTPMMATFYAFKGDDRRKDDDIDNLWNAFEAAIKLAENDSEESRAVFISAYNQVKSQFAVRWNLTMGLYWIRPYIFINLDSRNREFMSNPDNISANVVMEMKNLKSVPDAEKYLSMRDKCQAAIKSGEYGYSSFPELSYRAWVDTVQNGNNATLERELLNSAHLKWYAPLIQALRDLGGAAKPNDAKNKIIENEKLSKDITERTRGKNGRNKFGHEVEFARNDLVYAGYIDKGMRGIWALTDKGKAVVMTDELASDIRRKVNKGEFKIQKNSLGVADVATVHYWLYAPGEGASMWEEFYSDGIMGLGWDELGDLNTYASKDEMAQKLRDIHGGDSSYKNSAHAVWQFAHDIKPGDVIFAKRGRNEILGRGVVESDYEYDDNHDDEYPNIRKVKWTNKGSWQSDEMFAMKTLTDITNYTDFRNKISEFFEEGIEDEEEDIKAIDYPVYSVDRFLDEVYMDEKSYYNLVGVLDSKLNIILQGAPGVGKTFVAKRLAYSIMGVMDVERVMMVQFHQSYSYEDFIMGYRPSASSSTGFEIKTGAFYNFCKKAEKDGDNKYFFIIDEINRGNISKIFGELFMLIENDKRGDMNKIQLLYRNEMFYVPENVYIIGMMNTADRSLAMLDYALRRRFAFFDLKPGFTTEGFRAYRDGLDNKRFEALVGCVQSLNEKIAVDESLGEGFCIGHSYFCNMEPEEVTDEKLQSIVEYELIPMLREYWFDEPLKVKEWSDNLRSAVK